MTAALPPYVLITPARNEEAYIERTIRSVIDQTVRPERWVIVSDGSVDRTDEIVRRYEQQHPFITLLRVAPAGRANFGSKVGAFNAGLQAVGAGKFAFIGNLDADVTFGRDYFEEVLERFRQEPGLGIGGGMIQELINGSYIAQSVSLNSVAGAVQLFRRECYEAIGGYIAIRSGGIDTAAEIMARAKGWGVKTFPELPVLHHRRVVTGKKSVLLTRFNQGMTNYRLGYSPVFQGISCLYRAVQQPYVAGSAMVLAGYLWAALRRTGRLLPDDVRAYLRTEQNERLWSLVPRPGRGAERKVAPGVRGAVHTTGTGKDC